MRMTFLAILMLICIGLSAGMLSGLMGVGGGIILVPMLLLLGLSQHQAQGTSLAALLPPVTVLAVVNYYKGGFIDWKYAIVISLFFVIGGYFGSKLAVDIDDKTLRRIFGIILLLVAGKLIFGK